MSMQFASDSNLMVPLVQESNGNGYPSIRRLEGKVAIVTGGARGIGEATVRLFAKHGAKVVVADITDNGGEKISSLLSSSVAYMHCNVSKEEDVAEVVRKTVSKYGRLDIMFNNAGILGEQAKGKKSILDFDAEEFDRVMAVNVKGVGLGIKHAARVMVPRRSGCIISTSSVAGVMGGLGPHSYTASKHAIIGLTKNAACELGKHGIRVNAISPFGVATSMLINAWREYDNVEDDVEFEKYKMEDFVRTLASLKGPTLTAKDIAEAALYLASDEAKYVSGHNLVVDGGITTGSNCIGF